MCSKLLKIKKRLLVLILLFTLNYCYAQVDQSQMGAW